MIRTLRAVSPLENGTDVTEPPSQPAAAPPPAFEKPDYAGLLGKLMALSSLDPQPRGYAFEDFLKQVFSAFGLLPRGGFRTTGEQIDGSFVLAGETYLLEAKWHNVLTPAADLHAFQGKLNARVNWARGLFVSYSGFTHDGLTAYGRGGSVVCMDGLDLHDALQGQNPLNHVLSGRPSETPGRSGYRSVSAPQFDPYRRSNLTLGEGRHYQSDQRSNQSHRGSILEADRLPI